jgi:hypothetical protein
MNVMGAGKGLQLGTRRHRLTAINACGLGQGLAEAVG